MTVHEYSSSPVTAVITTPCRTIFGLLRYLWYLYCQHLKPQLESWLVNIGLEGGSWSVEWDLKLIDHSRQLCQIFGVVILINWLHHTEYVSNHFYLLVHVIITVPITIYLSWQKLLTIISSRPTHTSTSHISCHCHPMVGKVLKFKGAHCCWRTIKPQCEPQNRFTMCLMGEVVGEIEAYHPSTSSCKKNSEQRVIHDWWGRRGYGNNWLLTWICIPNQCYGGWEAYHPSTSSRQKDSAWLWYGNNWLLTWIRIPNC